MNEPGRIGLTDEASAQLDELLADLNPSKGEEGISLIKFDLYRLAVAVGIRKGTKPPALIDKRNSSFRVAELDEGGILYAVVESASLVDEGESIYEYIERLAEQGIREFYAESIKTGLLPFDEIFVE
ncbi:hypothetical protein GNP44_01050 [Aliivibrio fischeri]|uniref:hypothetical protein n=1 Tax=Aliivibrio fischeri TaxID=668 RepID=UPI0012D9B19E|nr:hypothetical protein [Aliivibrio fischeri]MUK28685.1 hypothetical protein [Aliivibrio fischeri]